MIDVGMGDEEEFDLLGLIDIDIPVPLIDFIVSLVHSAIHRKPMAIRFQNIAGPGNRPSRTHKLDLHFHPSPPNRFKVKAAIQGKKL